MWPSKDTRGVSTTKDGSELPNRPLQCAPTEDGRSRPDLVAVVTIASGRPQLTTPTTIEDPDVGAEMVDLLRQAPQLLQACASMRVLKKLRTISREARALATSHISSFTVDCAQPVIASHLEHSLTLLRACSLRNLRVILDIQQHERLEEDLFAITSTLRDPMMAVTQLDLVLSGVELDGNFTACEPSAHPVFGTQPASVLAALAPLCAPITHISVLGQVETSFDFCILPLLETAQALCSASLTHITVDVPCTIDRLESGDDSGPLDMLPSFPALNDDTCSMLRSLVSLTHLHLDGFIESPKVWAALPSTLISLKLAFVLFGPETGVVLPSLQRLALGQCGSSELALILKASPILTKLDLEEVCSPSTAVAAADLTAVYAHPLMGLDCAVQARNGAGIGAGLATTKYGHSCNVGTSDRELQMGVEMPPWRVLPLLPAMPAILCCSFDCVHSDQGEGPPLEWDTQPDIFLHHLPRVFPNMTHLDLACAIRPDADFWALHACTSLISLRLSRCDQLTDGGLLAMAASLTGLVNLEIELCGCVSIDAEEEVKHLMRERAAAKPIC